MPEWLVHFLALLIHFLLRHSRAVRRRRLHVLPSWWVDVPEYKPGSMQALAASIRGPFGNAIARMCRHWGIGPGHKDWPNISRAIVAFGGSLRGLDGRQHTQPWWEAPEFVPGIVRADRAARPAAEALQVLLETAAETPSPLPPKQRSATATPAALPASERPAVRRAGTGPPSDPTQLSCCA